MSKYCCTFAASIFTHHDKTILFPHVSLGRNGYGLRRDYFGFLTQCAGDGSGAFLCLYRTSASVYRFSLRHPSDHAGIGTANR